MKKQDNLRYPLGRFEYGKTYSMDDTRKNIKTIARFPKDLKKLTKKLNHQNLDTPYRPGGWTARQVFAATLGVMLLFPFGMFLWMRRRTWV